MQVKEYIQAVTDENMIRVEKIGSGNWYWSFLSDEKISKETALEKARADNGKAVATVKDLQRQVDEAGAAREDDDDDDDMLMEAGSDRKTMMLKHAELTKEIERLRTDLAAYSENDPVEVEKRKDLVAAHKEQAERLTEQIEEMEGWFRKMAGSDKEQFKAMKKNWYGDEYDEEEAGLKELLL